MFDSCIHPRLEADAGADGEMASLVRECGQDLLRHVRHGVGHDAAMEVVQESYVRVMRYAGQHPADVLRRLLFRIANNLVADHRKARKRDALEQAPGTSVETLYGIEYHTPESVLLGHDALRRAQSAIDALPPKCRSAFLLARLDGLPHSQVAERLGISVKMVEKHIANAFVRCQAWMDEN